MPFEIHGRRVLVEDGFRRDSRYDAAKPPNSSVAFDLINTDRPGHVEPLRDLVCDRCAVLGRRSRGACDQVRRQSLERSCRCREAIEVDPTRHRSSASLLSTLTFDLPADQLFAPGDNGYGPELLHLAVTVETHTPTVCDMLSG